MSYETRRRVILLLAALLVVALVLGSVGCSSTSGSGTGNDAALSPALYTQTMSDICQATNARLDALPTPPTDISRADWAGEVGRALRDEAAAFDDIRVGASLRDDHASFVANTERQSAEWANLATSLAAGEPDNEALGEITTEIGALTLGRNDLAAEMSLTGCQARQLG